MNNRPYDDPVSGVTKLFGRVVDYVGVFKNYTEALAYDPADLPPEIESPIYRDFAERLQQLIERKNVV